MILLQSRLLFIASFNVVVRLASQQRTREITRANKSSINKEEQSLCPKIRNGLDRWMARSRLAAFCPSATVKGAGRRTVCYSGSITASVSIRPDHAQTKAASRKTNGSGLQKQQNMGKHSHKYVAQCRNLIAEISRASNKWK